MFSGSYAPDDVIFLLKPVRIPNTPIEEKERLIQAGVKHYSEMITYEKPPSARYMELFHRAFQSEKRRLARHVLSLARYLHEQHKTTIVSLARAGTPIGVLLVRALRELFHSVAYHYSVSIIRDRGIDTNAVQFILSRHDAKSVAFVDGWTAKGVIARELRKSVNDLNERWGVHLPEELYVVADIGGVASWAATMEDYLIPSSVLGATISGLVSRSILHRDVVNNGDFHACLFYEEMRSHDMSQWFVDAMVNEMREVFEAGLLDVPTVTQDNKIACRQQMMEWLGRWSMRYGVRDSGHIKPGIGEATRVLLRRLPNRVIIRDIDEPAIEHVISLAKEKSVKIEIDDSIPFKAVAIIEDING
jgi:hypothetical protein